MTTIDLAGRIRDPARLEAVHRLDFQETRAGQAFDRLTDLARIMLHVPMAIINLAEEDRQFLLSVGGSRRTAMKYRSATGSARTLLLRAPPCSSTRSSSMPCGITPPFRTLASRPTPAPLTTRDGQARP